MPADITVPTVPTLARLERVELMHAGTWGLSTGTATFTNGDFAAAVGALDCPAVRRPHIKIGHTDPRWDGEPALGWVANMGLADSGRTLLGDLVGMPSWLGTIAASAYPDRSVEGMRNFRCQIGHLHPFVVTAVSLLGVTPPGIGTLDSLQDHPSLTDYTRALYEVAASGDDLTPGGEPVTVTFHANQEVPVPNPRPELVAAAVTVDELRTAYHAQAAYDFWITEIQLNPLQLIVTSDGNGNSYRIPVTVGADGDSFTFGNPVEVEVTYVDANTPEPIAAAARPLSVVFASRAQSRPEPVAAAEPANDPTHTPSQGAPTPLTDPAQAPSAPPSPALPVTPSPEAPVAPVVPAAEPVPTTEPEGGTDVSLSEIRSRLGLDETADEAAVLAALDERLTKPTEPPAELVAAAAKADKQAAQFAAAISQISTLSTELAAVKAEKAAERKAAFFAAATAQGKIAPAERESWESRYDRDAELVSEILGAIKPGTAVPVAAAGYTGDPEPRLSEDDLLMLLPPEQRELTGKDA